MKRLGQKSDLSKGLMAELVRLMEREVQQAAKGTFAQWEVQALRIADEVVRRCLKQELQRRADEVGDEVEVKGRRYRKHQPGTAIYHSLCGPLRIRRWTYRQVGVRNGPTIVPAEMVAGLVQSATPALAVSVTVAYSRSHMRQHKDALQHACRNPPSRSTLERIATRIGADAKACLVEIEASLRKSETLPVGTRGLVMSFDRTGVPMAEKPTEEDAWISHRRTPYERKAPLPVVVKYRMAYAASVVFTDEQGEAIAVRRYAMAAHEDRDRIAARVSDDVGCALKENPRLLLGAVQDGAPEMWGLAWSIRDRFRPNRNRWFEAIDYYHLMEHLAVLLERVVPNKEKRRRRLDGWKRLIIDDRRALGRISRWLDKQCHRLRKSDHWRLEYLAHNFYANQFDYQTMRAKRLPIGSGAVEAVCKTVIKHRTNGGGQRWSRPGLEAVLALRSLDQSDRLPRFWNRFSRRYAPQIRAVA